MMAIYEKKGNNYFCKEDKKSVFSIKIISECRKFVKLAEQWIRFLVSITKYKLLNEVLSLNIKFYWQSLTLI
jgi:hypothetical protein